MGWRNLNNGRVGSNSLFSLLPHTQPSLSGSREGRFGWKNYQQPLRSLASLDASLRLASTTAQCIMLFFDLGPIVFTYLDYSSPYHWQSDVDHGKFLGNLGSQKLMGILRQLITLTNEFIVLSVQLSPGIATSQTTKTSHLAPSLAKTDGHTHPHSGTCREMRPTQ